MGTRESLASSNVTKRLDRPDNVVVNASLTGMTRRPTFFAREDGDERRGIGQ
jgi:hypothetical protein